MLGRLRRQKSVEAFVCRVSPRPPSVHAEQGHLYLVRQARFEDEVDPEAAWHGIDGFFVTAKELADQVVLPFPARVETERHRR